MATSCKGKGLAEQVEEARILSECESYLTKIKMGDIVACWRMRQLADMMLPRIRDGYNKWHFDMDKANRPIEFIERFCCYPAGEKLGQPMELEPFQKAMVQLMFGFVDEDGNRQFQEVLWLIGRKNGKTSLGAALELYMLMADKEGAPQVYNVANAKDQASLAYGAAWKMVRRSTKLQRHLHKGTVVERDSDGIICDRTMGYITPLSSQTRNLDGLDVHFGLFDELAACTNRDQYDLVRQGMSARSQPLMLCITTNGFERDNIFDDRYEYACKILDGEVDDDRFLPIIYELDSRDEWQDRDCWIKANPGLGTIKKVSSLEDIVNEAEQNPNLLPTVLTKDFNVPENKAAAWLKFDECVNKEKFDLKEMGFRYGIAGFDASDTTDLSAACMFLMRPNDPRMYKISMYWLPEASLPDDGLRKERDDVPYHQWEKRGLIRLIDGNKVPKTVFIDWLEEVKRDLDIYTFALGYDPWHIIGTDEENLQSYVGKARCEEIRQGPKTLSDPMKQFRADLASGLIVNNHNPIDEWCRMNVSVKTDINANIQPVKLAKQEKNRIDGFMAELFAYIALMRHADEYAGAI